MAPRNSTQKELEIQKKLFIDYYGLSGKQFESAQERHLARRLNGEEPPFAPLDIEEHLYATTLHQGGIYDKKISHPYGLKPLGDHPLWLESCHPRYFKGNDTSSWSYDNSWTSYIFCFVPVPRQSEKHFSGYSSSDMSRAYNSGMEPNKKEGVVDGWSIVGFSTYHLWSMRNQRELDKTNPKNGMEVKDFSLDTEYNKKNEYNNKKFHPPLDMKTAGSTLYEGGSFKSTLSTTRRVTIRNCNNPSCTKQEKVETNSAEEEEKTNGPTLKKCSGCLKVYYCSSQCQASDWGQHKKVCKKATKK